MCGSAVECHSLKFFLFGSFQIALRAAFLEKENFALRVRLREVRAARDAASRECKAVKEELKRYEEEKEGAKSGDN